MRAHAKPLLIALGIGVVLAAVGWLFLTRGPMAPVRVGVTQVQRANLELSAFGIGTVEARQTYAIGPTQAGRVLAVYVDHGNRVAAGQLLAEMDPIDLRERARSAEAALAQANHAIAVAEHQALEAGSREQMARASHVRYEDLAQRRFVSQEVADIRRNEAEVAASARAAAQAAVAASQSGAAKAHQERDAARKQIANTRLTSPVDGVVVAREAEPGSTLVAGQSVLRLIAPQSLWVRTRFDQARAQQIAIGQPAEVALRSGAGASLRGRLARVDLQGDSITEERLATVTLEDLPATLYLGEQAEVTVRLPPVRDALWVPSAAVKQDGVRRGVWRIVEGKAQFVPVQTGVQTADGKTEVRAGLALGDQVIVHSDAQLRAGMRVRIDHD